jgi:hypothetical protein
MKPSYEVLPIEQFGHELLTSGDLDPVYIMLQGMQEPQLSRFLVAYWCTYHVGVASFLADYDLGAGNQFWHLLGSVAAQGPGRSPVGDLWPRGKERRHWRGQNAIKSFNHLKLHYPEGPAGFTDRLRSLGGPFKDLDKFIRSHVGFGPWISFKVGDMAEQVMGVPVNFEHAEVFMFDTPKEAARLLVKRQIGIPDDAKVNIKDSAIARVVAHLVEHFATYPAPNGKRRVNLQEVETILCKWKSHCSGHYPLYNDIGEVTHHLDAWRAQSYTARELYDKIPQGGL